MAGYREIPRDTARYQEIPHTWRYEIRADTGRYGRKGRCERCKEIYGQILERYIKIPHQGFCVPIFDIACLFSTCSSHLSPHCESVERVEREV